MNSVCWLRRALHRASIDQFFDGVAKTVWNALVHPCVRLVGRLVPDPLKPNGPDMQAFRLNVVGLLLLLPLQSQVASALTRDIVGQVSAQSISWTIWSRILLALCILERLPQNHVPSADVWSLWRSVLDSHQRQILARYWLRRSAEGALLVSVICPGCTGLAWYAGGSLLAVAVIIGPRAADSSGPVSGNATTLVDWPPGAMPGDPIAPVTRLEERQTLIAHHVSMVADGLLDGLFIYGRQGGLGKTTTVLKSLAARRITPVLINSHVTLGGLYEILHQHREGKVIIFDDCDALFRSLPQLGLLRSALYGDPRIITFSSSKLPAGIPERFSFHSRVIFCANVLPKGNPAFQAVLTRCAVLELSATNDEILETMRSVANRGFPPLTPEECAAAVDYLAEHAPPEGLSLRLLIPTWQRLLYARKVGIDWKLLVQAHLTSLSRIRG